MRANWPRVLIIGPISSMPCVRSPTGPIQSAMAMGKTVVNEGIEALKRRHIPKYGWEFEVIEPATVLRVVEKLVQRIPWDQGVVAIRNCITFVAKLDQQGGKVLCGDDLLPSLAYCYAPYGAVRAAHLQRQQPQKPLRHGWSRVVLKPRVHCLPLSPPPLAVLEFESSGL